MTSLALPADIRVFHTICQERELLVPKKDGFIGSWNAGNFTIEIAPKEGLIFLFKKDLDGKLISLKPIRTEGRRRVFEKNVTIGLSERENVPVTKWPKNHVKVIQLVPGKTDKPWEFRLWEIAVIAQKNGNGSSLFFLTIELTYQSRVFRDNNNNMVMPDFEGFDNWQDLKNYLSRIFNPSKFPLLAPLAPKKDTPALKLKDNEGIVLWFNKATGIGAIQTGKGAVRVHWSKIKSESRLKTLKQGQRVNVNGTQPAINKYPSPRITRFELDATEVS